MTPVLFPFTYLTPAAADSLRAHFRSVAVYQPVADRLPDEMRPLAEKGFLEVIAPPEDEVDFEGLVRDVQQWGCLHQGGVGLKTVSLHGSLYSEATRGEGGAAEIASEIRCRRAPEPASRSRTATLMARLILYLAQEADRQGFQITTELARLEKARARLFDALKGEADPPGFEFGSWKAPSDACWEDRLGLRMAAWARFFSSLPHPSPVFVTLSPAVVRHLAETVPGRLRLSFMGLSRTLQKLDGEKRPPAGDIMSQLAALARAPLCGSDFPKDDAEEILRGEHAGECGIHLWLGIPPRRFFDRIPASSLAEPHLPPPQFTWRNTVVVRIPEKPYHLPA